MNFSHWKTTVAGILLCVVTAAPLLEKVDWSHLTASVIIGLAGSLGTAFLGIISKDPGSQQ